METEYGFPLAIANSVPSMHGESRTTKYCFHRLDLLDCRFCERSPCGRYPYMLGHSNWNQNVPPQKESVLRGKGALPIIIERTTLFGAAFQVGRVYCGVLAVNGQWV